MICRAIDRGLDCAAAVVLAGTDTLDRAAAPYVANPVGLVLVGLVPPLALAFTVAGAASLWASGRLDRRRR